MARPKRDNRSDRSKGFDNLSAWAKPSVPTSTWTVGAECCPAEEVPVLIEVADAKTAMPTLKVRTRAGLESDRAAIARTT
jgi:hypothetical protein